MKTKTQKYTFYIGSNNETKKPEINKAIALLNNQILGYTINKNSLGLWEGSQEKSFKIEIINTEATPINDRKAKDIKLLLEKSLKQYLVLCEKSDISLLN